jgi:sulfate transport system permease protein
MSGRRLKKRGILPGFGLTMGLAMLYLSLIVLIPLSALFMKTAGSGWSEFWAAATGPRVLASYKLSFGAAFIAALVNSVFGLLVAWVLVRYSFPFKRLIDGLVDLPFALPTAVAGIVLTTLYAEHGWIGQHLKTLGIKAAFTPLGIVIALTFIGLPFVVRTVQPVLQGLESEMEETAAILGANRWQTFTRVLLPGLLPAVITGFALAFARGMGEYGSVVFISGNMPMQTEIAPLLIVTKLEQFDTMGAAAIAVVMLIASFVFLFLINVLQWWSNKYLIAR